MDIEKHAQMMRWLTRPRSQVPGPRNMNQGGRIIGKPGGVVEPGVEYYGTSKVYNEKTGHIYPGGNAHSKWWSDKPGKNQTTKSLKDPKYIEILTERINDPKYKNYNYKDLVREDIITDKEYRELKKLGIDAQFEGKHSNVPKNQANIVRSDKIKKVQGSNISMLHQGQTGTQFSHVYPLIESAPPGTQTTFKIDAKMNRKLEGFNEIGQKIAEEQELLIKNKPEGYKKRLEILNGEAKLNVRNAIQKLGPEYKGQIGYFQVDPETGVFKNKAGNYKMSFSGIEGENKKYIEMSGKERKDFERAESKKQILIDASTPEGRLNIKKKQTSVAFQKFLKENGIVIPGCGRQKVVTGGRITFSNGTCGGFKNADEFAKGDPENFLRTVQADSKAANVINKARPSEMQKVFKWAAKDMKSPTGWIGGDIAISTIFTANAFMEGKTPLEAVDQGLLWFLPEKVLNSYKKSLTEGMSEQDAVYIKRALDLETADNKYFTNKDELDNFNKAVKDKQTGGIYGPSIKQIENNRNRLINNINEASDIATNLYESFGAFERTGSGSDLPYIQGETSNAPTSKNYKEGYTNAMNKLFEAKKQKAVKDTNIAKQFDIGREYQKHLNDILMPDVIEEALGKGDKDYQDYDILGDKSASFTDYMPSLTRPLAPVTATIGQLAQGYASTDLPLAERLQDYLEKIAIMRNKENLTQPATMDNLTQQDFDIANQTFSKGGIANLKIKW